ncbi:MAG: hypothetical protein VB859_07395 [Planctomycetaceae bacterium]
MNHQTTRRRALQHLGLGGLASLTGPARLTADRVVRKKLPVAAVITQYFKYSHADVILGKILEGWKQAGGPGPDLELVSLYVDQFSDKDLSRGLAKKHGFRIAGTIDEALTLGKNRIPVAGVLSLGEHGNYPSTPDTKQHKYPRRRFFDEIVATMRRCDQYVPLFNDKHLGYRWRDAKHMVETARRLKIPLMAGSSLPVTWRFPATELPVGSPVEQALVLGHASSESYLFHALEALQCIVERRRGGETGVAAVTALRGQQIRDAEKRGDWSRELLKAAYRSIGASTKNLDQQIEHPRTGFFLIEYRDGLKATGAMIPSAIFNPPKDSCQLAVACRVHRQAEPFACWMNTPGIPFPHFTELLRGIQHMIHTREPAYPVERTLLTTGILDRLMHSMHPQKGKRLLSPELTIGYETPGWGFANRKEASES